LITQANVINFAARPSTNTMLLSFLLAKKSKGRRRDEYERENVGQ